MGQLTFAEQKAVTREFKSGCCESEIIFAVTAGRFCDVVCAECGNSDMGLIPNEEE